jgi:hypothetical protein
MTGLPGPARRPATAAHSESITVSRRRQRLIQVVGGNTLPTERRAHKTTRTLFGLTISNFEEFFWFQLGYSMDSLARVECQRITALIESAVEKLAILASLTSGDRLKLAGD